MGEAVLDFLFLNEVCGGLRNTPRRSKQGKEGDLPTCHVETTALHNLRSVCRNRKQSEWPCLSHLEQIRKTWFNWLVRFYCSVVALFLSIPSEGAFLNSYKQEYHFLRSLTLKVSWIQRYIEKVSKEQAFSVCIAVLLEEKQARGQWWHFCGRKRERLWILGIESNVF